MKKSLTLLLTLLLAFTTAFSYAPHIVSAEEESDTVLIEEVNETASEESELIQDPEIEVVSEEERLLSETENEETVSEVIVEEEAEMLPLENETDAAAVPQDVSFYEEESTGDIIFTTSGDGAQWLTLLSQGKGNIELSYTTEDASTKSFGIYDSEAYVLNGNTLRVLNSYFKDYVVNGTYKVKIFVNDYDNYESTEMLTITKALIPAPKVTITSKNFTA